MTLRINSLIASPGPEIGTTNRAAEGLRPIVDVAKFAEIQPGITPADVTLPAKRPTCLLEVTVT